MKKYILKADTKLNHIPPITNPVAPNPLSQPDVESNKERLFLHMEYSQNDISKKTVHAL